MKEKLPPELAQDIIDFGNRRHQLIHEVTWDKLTKSQRDAFVDKYISSTAKISNMTKDRKR